MAVKDAVSLSGKNRSMETTIFSFPLSAFVNLTAMANGENQDNHFFVLYLAQHSVVSNSISPESGAITSQRFSKMPGVFASLNPVV
ncbi:MAG: hypothetical protein PHF23_00400 [Smithellaceae bacterium]|nr:hypothetical protein [Smithellaceae bacterium]